MAFSRTEQVNRVGAVFQALAGTAIVVGILVGWILPHVATPISAPFSRTLAASGVDSTTFLGASLTTLGVIVAILIGYNVAGLQTAGQLMSLALARAMLLSLAPFLLWWVVTTGVGLVYLLAKPVYMGQLWQILIWFGAVVFFMLGYLWALPWRLSGTFAARWAVDDLRRVPLAQWEAQDGYDVLQSSMASATNRGDLGAVRSLAQTLGSFLVSARDPEGESENAYDRGRFRAIKNLVSGTAQFAGNGPTAVAFQLGFVGAGALIRSSAIGLPTGRPTADLFSGVLRAIGPSPDHHQALWAGMRHALCRRDGAATPYLMRYWRLYADWDDDDPRLTQRIADGLMRLHGESLRILNLNETFTDTEVEAIHMLVDFYRYLAQFLAKRIKRDTELDEQERLLSLTAKLLRQMHEAALSAVDEWEDDEDDPELTTRRTELRTQLVEAFDRNLAQILPA